jgi:hypothetical protein
MRRRDFLIAAGAALGAPLLSGRLFSLDQPLVQGYSRRFSLGDLPSAVGTLAQQEIHGLIARKDQMYLLLQHPGSNDVFGMSCSDLSGKIKWSWMLPPGYFWGPVVQQTGSIILYHRDLRERKSRPELMEFQENGDLIRKIPVGRVPVDFCLAGDNLVAVYPGGSADVIDLNGNPNKASRFDNVHPQFEYFFVEPLQADLVGIIDQPTARLVSLSSSGHAGPPTVIECPQIAESLKFYAADRKALEAAVARQGRSNVQLATPAVVSAACGDGSGRLYCLVSPAYTDKAVILQVDERGRMLRTLEFALPQRSGMKSKIPNRLSVLGNELFVVYPEGDAVVFFVS